MSGEYADLTLGVIRKPPAPEDRGEDIFNIERDAYRVLANIERMFSMKMERHPYTHLNSKFNDLSAKIKTVEQARNQLTENIKGMIGQGLTMNKDKYIEVVQRMVDMQNEGYEPLNDDSTEITFDRLICMVVMCIQFSV